MLDDGIRKPYTSISIQTWHEISDNLRTEFKSKASSG